MKNIKKLVFTASFAALGVVLSAFYIPVGASKCFPVQSMLNVLAGVLLGPSYAVCMAFVTSLIRVVLGTGSFLAFPGSMIGALCSGLLYKRFHRFWGAYLGEALGTGILGAVAAYPVAALLLNARTAALAYVIPFSISSFAGAAVSVAVLELLRKTKILHALHLQGRTLPKHP